MRAQRRDESVIEWADHTYRIDPARIYLTGISCGAIGVLDYLASSQERRVAATVPISSAPYFRVPQVRGGCAIARTPTWFFHGALDDIVPVHYAEDAVTDLHACKNPPPKEVKLTVYPDADHDAWTRTYDGSAGHDIYAWLLEQRLTEDEPRDHSRAGAEVGQIFAPGLKVRTNVPRWANLMAR